MPFSDGSVIIDTRINTDGFSRGAANLKSQFKGLGSSIGKLGKAVAAAFAVKTLTEFGKEAVQLGSDLQEVQNVVDVTFTTMRQKVDEFAAAAAKSAGLSETMAKRYVGTFGAMAKSFRFTEGEAYEMATTLTQLAGDVASFYNLTQAEAYTKLKSVFTGETETLKDLGVVMTQAALDDFALRKGLKKTTSQMSEQEKVSLRYQFVLEQLNAASGDFVRTSDSWANQTRILSLQFEQLKATIGQGLINVLTPAIKLINELLSKLQSVANKFRDFTALVFGTSGNNLTGSLDDAAGSAGDITDSFEDAQKAAKSLISGFDELNILRTDTENGDGSGETLPTTPLPGTPSENEQEVPEWLKKFREIAKEIKQEAEELAQLSKPWGDVFASFAKEIKGAIPEVKKAFEKLKEKAIVPFADYYANEFIPNIGHVFNETFIPIIQDNIPLAFDGLKLGIEDGTVIIGDAVGDLEWTFRTFETQFSDMCTSISKMWTELGDSLTLELGEMQTSVSEFAMSLYNGTIRGVVDKIKESINWLWENHVKQLWEKIVNFFGGFVENLAVLWNDFLYPLIKDIGETICPIIDAIITAIVDVLSVVTAIISDVLGGILDVFGGLFEAIVGLLTMDEERMTTGTAKVFEGLEGLVNGILTGIVNIIIWVINTIINLISSLFMSVFNAICDVVNEVGSWFGADWGFGWTGFEAPQIPYLAQGAVIPPNAPFMAVLGDQKHGKNIEAPLSTIEEAVANVTAEQSERMISAMYEFMDLVAQKSFSVQIGDETIGHANERYTSSRGIHVNTGAFANSY